MKQIWWMFYREFKYTYKKMLVVITVVSCGFTGIFLWASLRDNIPTLPQQGGVIQLHLFHKGRRQPVEIIEGIVLQLYIPSHLFYSMSTLHTQEQQSIQLVAFHEKQE